MTKESSHGPWRETVRVPSLSPREERAGRESERGVFRQTNLLTPALSSHFAGGEGEYACTGRFMIPIRAKLGVKASQNAGRVRRVPAALFAAAELSFACQLPAARHSELELNYSFGVRHLAFGIGQ